jgi:tetraacyldisaccharide 4'-kinase
MKQEFYNRIISGDAQGILPSLYRAFLSAFSAIYFVAWAARQAAFSFHLLSIRKAPARVISIGNITAGGTGKTPAVIYFARKFKEEGARVAVVSRGYGRRLITKEPVAVSDGEGNIHASPEEAGDEPYLMAQKLPGVPIVVCGNRIKAAHLAVERFGAGVILLDDGFQHRAIARDEDIVVIDCLEPFGYGHLLPRGLLREPLLSLRRASAFLLTHVDQRKHARVIEKLREINPTAEILFSRHQPVRLTAATKNHSLNPDVLSGKRTLAVSSIGNPVSFEQTLTSLHAVLAGSLRFPDHYWYTPADIDRIRGEASRSGAEYIVTTEKDGVRLGLLQEIPENLFLLEVELELIGCHPAAQ